MARCVHERAAGNFDPLDFDMPLRFDGPPLRFDGPTSGQPPRLALRFRDCLFDPALKDVSVDDAAATPVPGWLEKMAEDANDGKPPEDDRPKKYSKLDEFNEGSRWMAGMLETLRKDQVPMQLRQQLLDGCLKAAQQGPCEEEHGCHVKREAGERGHAWTHQRCGSVHVHKEDSWGHNRATTAA